MRCTKGIVAYRRGGGSSNPLDGITWRLLLEANRITGLVDNDAVTSWADASGNGHNASTSAYGSTGAPIYKTSIVNGEPVVRFVAEAASGDGLDLPTGVDDSLTEAELFAVVRVSSDPAPGSTRGGHFIQMGGDGTAANKGHFPWTDGVVYEPFGTSARKTVGNPTPSLSSDFRLYNIRTSSSGYSAYLDGTSIFSTGTNTVAFGAYVNGALLGHAKGDTDDRWWGGDLALLAIAPAVLSTGDRDIVHQYVEDTYGLTIA